MDFSKALEALKAGKKVTREEGTYIITTCIEGSLAYALPHGFWKYEGSEPLTPYQFTDDDILAEDWEIIEESNFKLGDKVMYGNEICQITRIDTLFCGTQRIFAETKNGEMIRDSPSRFKKIESGGLNEKYKKWLKKCVDDYKKKVGNHVLENDYVSAGEAQKSVELFEYCLNMFCYFEEK